MKKMMMAAMVMAAAVAATAGTVGPGYQIDADTAVTAGTVTGAQAGRIAASVTNGQADVALPQLSLGGVTRATWPEGGTGTAGAITNGGSGTLLIVAAQQYSIMADDTNLLILSHDSPGGGPVSSTSAVWNIGGYYYGGQVDFAYHDALGCWAGMTPSLDAIWTNGVASTPKGTYRPHSGSAEGTIEATFLKAAQPPFADSEGVRATRLGDLLPAMVRSTNDAVVASVSMGAAYSSATGAAGRVAVVIPTNAAASGAASLVGSAAIMFKTSAQTIASDAAYAVVTWEAVTNATDVVGQNDLGMADVANDRFVFATAGTGVYNVALCVDASANGDPFAAGTFWAAAIALVSGSTTSRVAGIAHPGGISGIGALPAVVAIRNTNDYIIAQILQNDTDGGAEQVAASTRTRFSICKVK